MRKGVLVALGTVVGCCGLWASSATAAVTLGQTAIPTVGCVGPSSWVQTSSAAAGPQYTASNAGVITSWNYQADATPPTLVRLRVGRVAAPPATIETVGRSAFEVPVASITSSFPTRVPIAAGDHIGLSSPGGVWDCAAPGVAGDANFGINGDPAPGAGAVAFPFGPFASSSLLPPSSSPTPTTTASATITEKPKKKDKKKTARFGFNSSETAPTFRCSHNGSAFEPCTAPHAVKAKKGLNTFTVFARDAAGNIDESPATYSWTFKKPKKK